MKTQLPPEFLVLPFLAPCSRALWQGAEEKSRWCLVAKPIPGAPGYSGCSRPDAGRRGGRRYWEVPTGRVGGPATSNGDRGRPCGQGTVVSRTILPLPAGNVWGGRYCHQRTTSRLSAAR